MAKFKELFPVLFSPKFWGICLFAVINYVQAKGWLMGAELELLEVIVGAGTGVGVLDSLARKVGK